MVVSFSARSVRQAMRNGPGGRDIGRSLSGFSFNHSSPIPMRSMYRVRLTPGGVGTASMRQSSAAARLYSEDRGVRAEGLRSHTSPRARGPLCYDCLQYDRVRLWRYLDGEDAWAIISSGVRYDAACPIDARSVDLDYLDGRPGSYALLCWQHCGSCCSWTDFASPLKSCGGIAVCSFLSASSENGIVFLE